MNPLKISDKRTKLHEHLPLEKFCVPIRRTTAIKIVLIFYIFYFASPNHGRTSNLAYKTVSTGVVITERVMQCKHNQIKLLLSSVSFIKHTTKLAIKIISVPLLMPPLLN